MKKWLLIVAICMIALSCTEKNPDGNNPGEDDTSIVMYIASQKYIAMGIPGGNYYFFRYSENEEWEILAYGINNFEYEPGYEYKIRAKLVNIDNPPEDSFDKKYICSEILSKIKKTSDLPERWQ